MNASDERTRSLWMDVSVADAPQLRKNVIADTVIVGSGIAGLSTAYELALKGQKVVVLDRGRIAGGMTSRTTAHLTSQSDDGFETLIRVRGLEGAKSFYESHSAAIDRIEAVQKEENIDCHFRRVNGYLFPAIGSQASELTAEFEATKRVRMPIERHVGLPFKGLDAIRCLRYPNLATFHPLRYLRGIAEALGRYNAQLFANTIATDVKEHDGVVTVRTANGATVSAGQAIVATNSPINDRFALHPQLAPYRTYAMAISIDRDSIEDALYWDTLDPYHYVRLENGRGRTQYLIVGGADHRTGEADDGWARFEGLESWIRALLPKLGNVTHRWSGQILDPVDYSAFIGRNPGDEHIFVHTGDSGQGLTHGVVGSMLLSNLILGHTTPWTEFYDPARIAVAAARNFVAENVTSIKNLAEYIAPGELTSADELQPGQGGILRDGFAKIAVYRDDSGALYRHSAACTHAGCNVHWNSLEKCWDCPCHGSQFAPDGTALNAPAIQALSSAGSANVAAKAKAEERTS